MQPNFFVNKPRLEILLSNAVFTNTLSIRMIFTNRIDKPGKISWLRICNSDEADADHFS